MKTLRELHEQALGEGWAVPHFNFADSAQLQGICDALRELKSPALIGASEGERSFVGMRQAVALVRSLREEGLAVFLNADHCRSVESAKEAADAGFDSIHADLSKLKFEDNMRQTREVVEYVNKVNPEAEVEGELGYLATDSSKVYKEEVVIPEDSYTNVEQAVEFAKTTGIDRLAPAIGTIHGIAANTPQLKFELAEALRKALGGITLVLHGGSGVTDEEKERIAKAGFNNIHVSTELRIAFHNALADALQRDPEEVVPYKYLSPAREATAMVVAHHVKLFDSAGRA